MNNIIFKKADGGSAIFIMDNDDYLREAHNQIFNDEYYKILKGVLYSNAFRKLSQYKKSCSMDG